MLSFLESRFLSAIEWFVPRSRAALDADGLRRSRLTIGAVGAVLVCTLLTGAWLLVSVPDRKPYPLLFLAFGATCVPFVLRQTGSLRVTGHTIGAVFSIALASMIWRNGAETYPPFAVLPVIPMVTMLIAGTGAGVFWAVVSLAQVGLFFALHQRGLRPFEPLEATFVDQGRFVGTALMVLFVLLFTYLYERLKNRALEDLVAERQRQVELRDRFLSHVSHELRTPVAAADQFVGLVADEVSGEINHEQREFLEGALRNTKHLVAMIDDLVAVSRVRFREMNLELADLSVGQLLRNETSRWSTMGAEHGVPVRLVAGDELPLVRAQSTAVKPPPKTITSPETGIGLPVLYRFMNS